MLNCLRQLRLHRSGMSSEAFNAKTKLCALWDELELVVHFSCTGAMHQDDVGMEEKIEQLLRFNLTPTTRRMLLSAQSRRQHYPITIQKSSRPTLLQEVSFCGSVHIDKRGGDSTVCRIEERNEIST